MGPIVKNTLRGLLCSLLLLSLCACGGSDSVGQGSPSVDTEAAETQDQQEMQDAQESAAAPAQPEAASDTIQRHGCPPLL